MSASSFAPSGLAGPSSYPGADLVRAYELGGPEFADKFITCVNSWYVQVSKAHGLASASLRSASSAGSARSLGSAVAGSGLTGTRLGAIRRVASWRGKGDFSGEVGEKSGVGGSPRVGGKPMPDGLCYSKTFRRACAEDRALRMGEWPTFSAYVRQPAELCQSLESLDRFRLVAQGGGLYHVAAGGDKGVSLLSAIRTYASGVRCSAGTIAAAALAGGGDLLPAGKGLKGSDRLGGELVEFPSSAAVLDLRGGEVAGTRSHHAPVFLAAGPEFVVGGERRVVYSSGKMNWGTSSDWVRVAGDFSSGLGVLRFSSAVVSAGVTHSELGGSPFVVVGEGSFFFDLKVPSDYAALCLTFVVGSLPLGSGPAGVFPGGLLGQGVSVNGDCLFLAGSGAASWRREFASVLGEKRLAVSPDGADASDCLPSVMTRDEDRWGWEEAAVARSGAVLFNFLPGTSSSLSLFELGRALALGKSAVVVCPKEFRRSKFVWWQCENSGVRVFESLGEMVRELAAGHGPALLL